jgi:hypothetical protein
MNKRSLQPERRIKRMEIISSIIYTIVIYFFMVYGITTLNNLSHKTFASEMDFTEGITGWSFLTICTIITDDWDQKISNLFLQIFSIMLLVLIWRPCLPPFITISLFFIVAAVCLFIWLIYKFKDI